MLPIVALGLVVTAAYLQSLGGPFVWDDRPLILDSQLVEGDAAITEFLGRPLWAGQGTQPASLSYYRPLVTLSFALDHRLHGTNPGGYHLTNLVFHLASAIALQRLLARHGARAWTATGMALGWALLPRLAEAAAWVSGRTDAIAGAFALWAMVAWGPSPARRVGAAALLGVALLAKESALAVPAALIASDWVRHRDVSAKERLRVTLFGSLPLLLVVLGYLALRLSLVGYEFDPHALGVLGRIRTVLEAMATYAMMLVDPLRPRAVIGRAGAVTAWGTALGSVVLIAAAASVWRLRTRLSAVQVLGLSLFVFALLPVSHVVPIPLRTLVADRFLYLPTAGLALAATPAVERLLERFRLARGLLLACLVVLFASTVRRVAVWSDEIEFWVETYLEAPSTNNAAAIELSGVLFRGGMVAEAAEISARALRSADPNQRNASRNMAVCLSRLGRRAEALPYLLGSTSRPTREDALLVALMQIQEGAFTAAEESLSQMAKQGDVSAKGLLARLPSLREAHAGLAAMGPAGDSARRARLASALGDAHRATPAWVHATASPNATRETLLEGIWNLASTSEKEALARAAKNFRARFGPLDPELSNIVEMRLVEIDRLRAALPRLGLKVRPPMAVQ